MQIMHTPNMQMKQTMRSNVHRTNHNVMGMICSREEIPPTKRIIKKRRTITPLSVRSSSSYPEPQDREKQSTISTQRNLPVPVAPPNKGPPPPPPPPPPPMMLKPTRRESLISAVAIAGIAIGMVSGFNSGTNSQDENQLAYVASQIAAPGMPSPVSAVLDRSTGDVVALIVLDQNGTQYASKVDPRQPSRMLLEVSQPGRDAKNLKRGTIFALETRFDTIELANRRQIESIFRVVGWENALQRIN